MWLFQYAAEDMSAPVTRRPETLEMTGSVGALKEIMPAIISNMPKIGSIRGEWKACDTTRGNFYVEMSYYTYSVAFAIL